MDCGTLDHIKGGKDPLLRKDSAFEAGYQHHLASSKANNVQLSF